MSVKSVMRVGRGYALPINSGANLFYIIAGFELGETFQDGDVWLNPATGAISTWDSGTENWIISGSSEAIANAQAVIGTINDTTDFASENYISDGMTLIQALEALDTAMKAIQDGLNPQGFALAMTGDTAFNTSVSGPIPFATEPADFEGTAGTFTSQIQNGDVLFNIDGTRWVADAAESEWVKDTDYAPVDRYTYGVKLDLPDQKYQELAAIYLWKADQSQFIRYGKSTTAIAAAITLSSYVFTENGTDSTYTITDSDTVQSALQKLDGAIRNNAALLLGTGNRSARDLGTLSTNTVAIGTTESVKSLAEKVVTQITNLLTAVGIAANSTNLGALASNEANPGSSETVKSAVEKLSTMAIKLTSGAAGADVSSVGTTDAAHFFVSIKDTTGDKRLSFQIQVNAWGIDPADYDDSGIMFAIRSDVEPTYTLTVENDTNGKPKITIGGLSGTTSARIKRIDM